MPKNSKSINLERLFKSLVESAIDFAEKSIDELKNGSPKHSATSFCTALELFLKARLMLEHWTLIVSNPARANPQKFHSGDFHSVSMEEAIERLENVAGQNFRPQEKKIFEIIREQRNRFVHFVDPLSIKHNKKMLEKIAAQEHSGWFYLHRILTMRWRKEFNKFQDRIGVLGTRLHKIRAFLRVKFNELAPAISAEKAKGLKHKQCPRCRFKSYRQIDEEPSPPKSKLVVAACLVCELQDSFLRVGCEDCNRSIVIRDMAEGKCKCGFTVDAEWLVEELAPSNDPGEEPNTAYCTNCERTDLETVVPIDDTNGYICVSCLCTFDATGECGFCSSRNAGEIDSVDSYLSGCVVCEGMVAEDHT